MGWARPGRSAVLGLVVAAQGIGRADEAAHQRLETGLHYAVRTDAPGRPLMDYHTAQTPKARRGRTFTTRRDALDSDALNTVLSAREWRTDALFTVALMRYLSRVHQRRDASVRAPAPLLPGRMSAEAGFEVGAADVAVDGYDQHRIPRTGSAPAMSYSTVDFEGILTVRDPATLLPAIAHGFGAAKAYGCGLMLIRRA